jgi:tetratricopeptide (TPR) repeat protein
MSTEAARHEMRFASQYLQKYRDSKQQNTWFALDNLTFALKYIQKARALDPTVTLMVQLRDKELGMQSLDCLEAEILGSQAEHLSKDKSSQAIAMVQRAISLEPGLSYLYAQLANLYHREGHDKRAIALLQDAVAKFPDDFHIRSTLDDIEARPTPPKRLPFSHELLIAGGIVLGLVILFNIATPQTLIALFISVTVVSAVIAYVKHDSST